MSCTTAASHDEGVSRIFRSWLCTQEHVCERVATKVAQETTKSGRGASATWGPMMAGTTVPLSRDGLERLEAADCYMRSWGATASSASRTNPNALDAGSRGRGPNQVSTRGSHAVRRIIHIVTPGPHGARGRARTLLPWRLHLRPGDSVEPPGTRCWSPRLPRGLASPRWCKPLALRQ